MDSLNGSLGFAVGAEWAQSSSSGTTWSIGSRLGKQSAFVDLSSTTCDPSDETSLQSIEIPLHQVVPLRHVQPCDMIEGDAFVRAGTDF